MAVKFTNNAEGTLTAGVGSGDTTNMTLTAGDGLLFPTIVAASGDYFYATLVDVSDNVEIVKVTEHQNGTDVFQAFVRAQDGTSAIAFAIADKVQLRLPKIILEEFRDDIDAIETAATALTARVAINETDLAGTTNPATVPAPSTTKMYFYQDAAPATWTIDAGPADSLLAVKGGAQDYNDTGGQKLGSWTPTTHVHGGIQHTHTGPSHTHTGPSHTHTGPSHTHTGPNHTHTVDIWATDRSGSILSEASTPRLRMLGGGGSDWISASSTSNTAKGKQETTAAGGTGATAAGGTGVTGAGGTGATGADGTGVTGSSGGDNTDASSQPSTDRPQAAVGIIATKD